jgi:hypothetical protein
MKVCKMGHRQIPWQMFTIDRKSDLFLIGRNGNDNICRSVLQREVLLLVSHPWGLVIVVNFWHMNPGSWMGDGLGMFV